MEINDSSSDKALKAGTWYVISSIVVKGVAVISTPIFTRMMTISEYGMVATFLSWYALLYPICTCNLSFSIGRAKLDYPGNLDRFIGAVQLLSLFISITITVVLFAFKSSFLSLFAIDSKIYDLLLLYLIISPIIEFRQNGYRYRYKYKQNIAIAWFLSLLSVVLSVTLMRLIPNNKAELRIIGIIAPSLILSLLFWVNSARKRNININIEYWKYGFLISSPMVFHTLSLNILSQADRIFITRFCGESETGIYSLVYSYGLLITVITNAIADGWLPWFHDAYHASKFSEIKKNVKWIVVLGCYIGLACVAFAPEAIFILGGKEYVKGVYCVPPIVVGVVCQFIYTHYVNIELHLKKTKFVALGTALAAVINIILNYIFVPKYGFVVAAYTTLISYIVLLILHFLITRKWLRVRIYNDFFMFSSLIITGVIAIGINFLYANTVIRFAVIIIGLCSFIILMKGSGINILLLLKKGD